MRFFGGTVARIGDPPRLKLGWFWNQWLVGVMLDKARILDIWWLVLILGPATISIRVWRRGA